MSVRVDVSPTLDVWPVFVKICTRHTTHLGQADGASVGDDITDGSTKRLHGPLGLGSNLPHLDKLLVHGKLRRDELISRFLGLREIKWRRVVRCEGAKNGKSVRLFVLKKECRVRTRGKNERSFGCLPSSCW